MKILKDLLAEKIKETKEKVERLKKEKGEKVVSEIRKIDILSGLRGIKSLICETSFVDPEKGLIIRGIPIAQLSEKLPEEVFWLLLTEDLPSENELKDFQNELAQRSEIPKYIWGFLKSLPKESHPMAMLSLAILALQKESNFAKKFQEGLKKDEFWLYTLQDCLDLIAKLPIIAAGIYQIKYKGSKLPKYETDKTWSENFVLNLEINNKNEFFDLVKLYLVLHCDHEGGNVSVNTARIVSSALADPYYAISAGLNGLAGPLHGLACQDSVNFLNKIKNHFQKIPEENDLRDYIKELLDQGNLIPGYGHAVLRQVDPRFTALLEFGKNYKVKTELFELVQLIYKVVPDLLKKQGKAKNPYPNVDAISGSLLYSYGLKELDYYTVFFALSRVLGISAQIVWDRALGLPIFRPKSVTLDQIL